MKSSFATNNFKPFLVLILGVVFSVLAWAGLSYFEHTNAKAEFAHEADEINKTILERLTFVEELLNSVKAFFMASEEVSLQEWEIYFSNLRFEEKHRGLHGVSYLKRIKSDEELLELQQKLQRYGMDDFEIKPEGVRDEYFPVIYLEPLNDSNKKAIGYDIYSEKTRRDTIQAANSKKETRITRKITLVQEEKSHPQSGILMMVPFFKNERIGHQNAERELDGLINGVIRMEDFIKSQIPPAYFANMRLRIYDHKISEQNLLFDSMDPTDPKPIPERFSNSVVLNRFGQNWTIKIDGQPGANHLNLPFGERRKTLNLLVLYLGYALSVLAFYLTRVAQTTARMKKQKAADLIAMKANEEIIRRQEDSLLKFKDQSEYHIVCVIDIVNSTTTTAQLTGRQAADFYSAFHNVMSEVIRFHKGRIVKLMGDAILYYFEASAHLTKEDCKPAIDCSLDLIKTHGELNRILDQRSLPPINYRISATYGSVMSATKNNVRDIFGPTVNQCSKINRYAKTNGLIISKHIKTFIEDDRAYEIKEVKDLSPDQHGSSLFHVSHTH